MDNNNLRAMREKAGITQRELAVLAGSSLTHISNIEAGIVPKRGDVTARVVEVLRGLPAGPPAAKPDRAESMRAALAALDDDQPDLAAAILRKALR